MEIILYTTDCPKCKILEKKLEQAGIEFVTNRNTQEIIDMGFMEAPILNVGGVYHNFLAAVNWLKNQEG